MDATNQVIFNLVLGFAGAACLFLLKLIWDKLNALEKNDKELTNSINKLEILVSGEYVKKTDINPLLQSIFDELKSINKELSHKLERRQD